MSEQIVLLGVFFDHRASPERIYFARMAEIVKS